MSLPPRPSTRRPALCVINFNGSHYLSTTLTRVLELREQFSEIIFVDDASTDDSIEVAASILPQATIVRLSENSGPGAARNAGAGATVAHRILFADNDVTLGHDVLPRLEAALDHSSAPVIAVPRVVSASNPGHIEYEGGEAHVSGLLSLRVPKLHRGKPSSTVTPIGSLVTCCFLLDRERWGDAPLFDEAFRIYLEDHELGLRARMRGKEMVAVPEAVCLHGTGTPGLSIRATGHHTSTRIRQTILNRWQVVLKLYETRTLILLAPYLLLFEISQLAGCIAVGWGREWWGAARDLMGRAGDLKARRRAFQQTRCRGDIQVLSAGPHPFNPALTSRRSVRSFHRLLDLAAAGNWWLARGLLSRGTSV